MWVRNRCPGVLYQGSDDDDALNDSVQRYAADQGAVDYLRTYFTPAGELLGPMLAIHTTYDPLVPGWVPNSYQTIADLAGASELFVQQYVKRPGHCSISQPEIERGLAQLRKWVVDGVRPEGGALH